MERKVRRQHYAASFKRTVILFAERSSNLAAQREFTVSEVNVRRWRGQRVEIFGCSATRKAFTGPRSGCHPELENELAEFIRQQRAQCFPLNSEIIRAKAREIARRNGIPRTDFKASLPWVQRFMKRNGFSLRRRTSICQKLPADYEEKLIEFQRFIIRKRREVDYQLGQIGNADQTPMYFDMPSQRTVEEKGKKQVLIRSCGCEKQRMTVMLCCTADGHKLPPYVILKRKTISVREKFPRNVIVRANVKGWMTSEMVVEWIKLVWLRRPGALLQLPSLLVLDSFCGHMTEEVKQVLSANKCQLAIIPGGMTSQLQPLDVSINKPVKDRVQKLYIDWLTEQDRELTPSGRIKRAPASVVCGWIADAWFGMEAGIIIRSFKKCSISNALDGTEDGVLWEEDSDKESSSEGEDEVTDSEDSDED